MTNDSPRSYRRDFLAGAVVAVASALALVSQVLALASDRFRATLNSDYLLAHAFSRELLVSPYPISGWKFGMGSFAFPDYAIYLPWFGVFGDSGASYPAYAATLWLGYFAAFAWALRSAGARWLAALAASGVAINLLLSFRSFAGGCADRLWQLSLPAYHGGNLLLELCCFALVFGAVRAGAWKRGRLAAFGAIAALGIFSNAQLLLHVLIPVGALIFFSGRVRPEISRSVLSGYIRAVGVALAVAVAARVVLALTEVFYFASLFKTWPLPWLMWGRLLKFLADFRTELLPELPAVWAVAFAGVVTGIGMVFRTRWKGGAEFFAPAAMLMVLASVTATPIAAVYWKDAGSMRYLLPWLVFPAWVLAHAATTGLPRRVGGALAAIGMAATAFFGVNAVPQIRRDALLFPHPLESLALRDHLRANGLRSGLCHFWEGHLLQNAWGYDGPRLAHIRDADFCEFWCNNAFGYFPVRSGGFGPPEFDFVILNRLDVAVLRERLGGEFSPVMVGPYAVVKLSPDQARRASSLVEAQALDFLAGRRADLLKVGLRAPPSN